MTSAILIGALILQSSATQMTASVSGLPSGIEPEITVTGPDGAKHALAPGQPLVLSQPGSYSLSGEAFRKAGQIVDTIYEAATVQGSIKAGESKSLVLKYTPRGGTGRLLTISTRINEDEDDLTKGQVRSLNQDELLKGGFQTGSRLFEIPARAGGGAVHPSGMLLFTGGWDEPSIMRMTSTALGGNGARSPIQGTDAQAVTIDPKGNIWVHKDDLAVCYPGASALKGTAGTPLVTLKSNPDSETPISFAQMLFDHDGSMILFGGGWIQRVAASSAAKSGVLEKDAVKIPTGSINGGALDQEGNLWLTDENGAVWKFARQDDGSFSSTGTEYPVPQSAAGIAIDNEGGVWVLVRYTGALMHLSPIGSAFEERGIFGRGHTEWSKLILNPPPAWSPLGAAFPQARYGDSMEHSVSQSPDR